MITKLKKYFKIMICSALIFSLILPSYAALSATDGSTFITKAEFDSALSDFNARLTTFEAGINSKIDSQVTSYLDRNGIWNGHEQSWLIDVGSRKNIVIPRISWVNNGTSETGDINVAAKEHMEILLFNKKVVTVSKSGLCTMVWGYHAGNDTSKNNNRLYLQASQAYMGGMYLEAGLGDDIFTESVCKSSSGTWSVVTRETTSMKNVMWCTLLSVGGGDDNRTCMPYGEGTIYTSQFFVTAGDTVWARWRLFADAGGSALTLSYTNSDIMSKTESYRPEVVFESCKVY